MKQRILIAIIALFSGLSLNAHGGPKAERMGLIAELAYIKTVSEGKAMEILNDSCIDKRYMAGFFDAYNETKVLVDQFVLQLITDCAKNCQIGVYVELDNMLKDYTIEEIRVRYDYNYDDFRDIYDYEVGNYLLTLKKIHRSFKRMKGMARNLKSRSMPDCQSSYVYMMPYDNHLLATGNIKDLKLRGRKKVDKLAGILDELRLCSLQHLNHKRYEQPREGVKEIKLELTDNRSNKMLLQGDEPKATPPKANKTKKYKHRHTRTCQCPDKPARRR